RRSAGDAEPHAVRTPRARGWQRMMRRLAILLRYALPYRRQWGVIIFATLVGSLMTLLQPWPMKLLVDQVFLGQEAAGSAKGVLGVLPQSTYGLLAVVVLAGLVIFLANSVSDVLLTRAWLRFGHGMVYSVAQDLY